MSVRRPRAVGAPGGATLPGVEAAPARRLNAVLRAGQARPEAPVGAPAADPKGADDPPVIPYRTIDWHRINKGADDYAPFVTTDPLRTFMLTDEMNAYVAARLTFESLLRFYERNSSGMYPSEARILKIYSKLLPTSEDDRRILKSRLAEIRGILATEHRPKRKKDDNPEYIKTLEEFIKHVDQVARYQLSTDAKIWRERVQGTW